MNLVVEVLFQCVCVDLRLYDHPFFSQIYPNQLKFTHNSQSDGTRLCATFFLV